ncbi:MAG TPA: sigma 54-interacting transcriptional regulator, partial [Pseudomonadales bacterium]|nr:sigma 54-interacting transcriptional regulator [Pseudomonadales bacterium]
TVLITGETGVGKELVARAVHSRSLRSQQPLVELNCAAIPENLIESELFGHLKGAFSGAVTERRGKFDLADGGSLFLDEVGELPLNAQAKLLRALHGGEIQRVGSDRVHRVDVRIIAATNRDLQQEVRNGRFRADLYHRLSVFPLWVPPLRERERDALLLAGYFLEQNRGRLGVRALRLAADCQAALLNCDWPGNVRELEHLISRAALRARAEAEADARIVTLPLPPLGMLNPPAVEHPHARSEPDITQTVSLRQAVDDCQRDLLRQRLALHRGNWARTARSLGVDRGNLIRLAQRLGLRN